MGRWRFGLPVKNFIPNFLIIPSAKQKHFTQPNFDVAGRVVQILQLIKYFFAFRKVETFPFRDNFPKLIDWLLWQLDFDHFGTPRVGGVFQQAQVIRIRFFFFVFCIDLCLFLQLCQTIANFKNKKESIIWEMFFVKLYTDGDISMFFNILWNILQIFMFFVGLLYTLLINNLLITTTDTYHLYISNTVYCNKQWECNSNNNKRSAGCVSDWKPSDFLSVCLRLCVYLIGLKGFTVGEEEISDNWYFFVSVGCSLHSFKLDEQIFDISVSVCEWVLLFSLPFVCVRRAKISSHSRRSSASKSKSCFFFVCSYWLNCVCFFYFVWIIYYYYYSITTSEIKKRSLQKKKENVGIVVPGLLSLFCFVLLDFCCRKSREPNAFGSLNSANITNDNLHFHFASLSARN